MPRTPEVCPTVCPLSHFSNTVSPHSLPIRPSASHRLPPAFRRLPSASCVLQSAVCLLLLLITHHSSLITAYAQGATATLTGIVTDQNGAVVPGVNIAVINIGQGFQRTTTTSNEGTFVVPLLPPSTYTVKAERAGFSTGEMRDVVLNVNGQVTIRIRLSIGSISQTVLVDGGSLIDESPAVGTVVDRQFVANLPLNGRSFQSLITLTPGVVLTAASGVEFGQFSVNGQRANTNYFSVDGVSANVGTVYAGGYDQAAAGSIPAFGATGGTSNLASIDALQEFKVLTSTYAPEFGRTPGGQVSIVTRSGTNDFHGTLFEYLRNDVLDANDWFLNSRGVKKPALRQNIFGGTVGGPILFPRFGEGGHQPGYNGRNRSFFFFSYEGQRLLLPKAKIVDVPSHSARQDPSASAAIKQLLNAFPLPTGSEKANRFAEQAAGYSDPSSLDATSIRIDHTINRRLTAFGRYNYSPSKATARGLTGGAPLNNVISIVNKTQTMTAGVTLVLTPTITNEFLFNWSKVRGASVLSLDDFGGAIVPPTSFFIPSFASPTSAGTLINLSGGVQAMFQVGNIADNLQRQLNLVNNIGIATGSHGLKFGIDYRHLSPIVGARSYTQSLIFGGVVGALTGRTGLAVVQGKAALPHPVFNNFSAYGQDTWTATRRMTLTYGMRWEVNPPPKETTGNDPAVVTGLDHLATATLAPFGSPLYKTTYNNFAPRVGAAFQLVQNPGRETVLRGGFGIFYDLGNDTAGAVFGPVFPYISQKVLFGAAAPVFPLSPAEAAVPLFSRDLPAPIQVIAIDPDLKLPRTYQWNFAIEQSFGANQTLSASYVAAVGRRLLRQATIGGAALLGNPNFLSTSVLTITKNAATSDYHAMQLQFQRRLSRGFQTVASYTWSHSIDIASTGSATSDAFPSGFDNPQIDRGPSDYDIRHALSFAATYNMPTPRTGSFGKTILRDWSIDAIYTAQSARPVDIIYFHFTPTFGSILARPDLISGVPLYLYGSTFAGGRRINSAAFDGITPNNQLRQGTLGRNSVRAFPLSQLNFAVGRQFRLKELANLQLKAEIFNLFNHPNFGIPNRALSSSTFGQAISLLNNSLGTGGLNGGLNPLYQLGGPRSIQMSLRLQF